jgi:membrane-bound lytic murein transglycosylase A
MKRYLASLVIFIFPSFSVGDVRITHFDFSDLLGWSSDNHDLALDVFKETCPDLKAPDWSSLCAIAQNTDASREFFEIFFKPVHISRGDAALFTGYFEPEINGSRIKTDRFSYPVYSMPPELRQGQTWLTREEIETSSTLRERGLEIAWVDDLADLFFLQIQGSGRIKLDYGGVLRIGYAGSNSRPFKSVAEEFIRLGILEKHQASAKMIKSWVRKNPQAGSKILWHNESYVFFRVVEKLASDKGPVGAMNRSLTALRSLAVDPDYVPLGAPVWINKKGTPPMRRLMIAQDTGSVIKGSQRADIFLGSGDIAGDKASQIKDGGSLFVLLPFKRAMLLSSHE